MERILTKIDDGSVDLQVTKEVVEKRTLSVEQIKDQIEHYKRCIQSNQDAITLNKALLKEQQELLIEVKSIVEA